MKNKLAWCAGAKNGIMLIEPNNDLASAYLRKAEDAMEAMHSVASHDWKISAGYYSLYFSLYSVLMKTGIKSENHVCTVEIMQHLLGEYFSRDECELMEQARHARVKSQYYTTSEVPAVFEDVLAKQVPQFLVKCRGIVDRLDTKKIQKIRKMYTESIKRKE
jgi:uncharacterized protein (UPF0332 family)